MTNRLLAGCALLALSASASTAADFGTGPDYYAPPASSPAAGPAGVFGDVHLSATYFGTEGEDDGSIDLGGVVVVPFANGWNAAFEADTGYLFNAGDWAAAGAGHLFFLTSTWAAGAFVEGNTETDGVGVGVEAAAYISNVDVIGTVEYGFSDPDFWLASAATNIYFDPNTALTAGLGGVWFDGADGSFAANVGLEHRFNNSPVSGFAEVGWTDITGDDTIIATAGARVVFGAAGQTLQDYNRANPF